MLPRTRSIAVSKKQLHKHQIMEGGFILIIPKSCLDKRGHYKMPRSWRNGFLMLTCNYSEIPNSSKRMQGESLGSLLKRKPILVWMAKAEQLTT